MKNVLKTALFAALLIMVACGDAVTEKETTIAAAATTAKAMVEEKAKEGMEKAEAMKDEMIEKADMAKDEMTEKANTAKADMKKEMTEKANMAKEDMKKEVVAKANTAKEDMKKEVIEKVAVAKEAMPKTETPAPKKVEVKKEIPKAFSHAAWNTLAQKHISSTGKVNYKGFKADIAAFDAYLKSLADNPVQSSWSRGEKMAYWINAYNAFTIKLIVDNYPVKSITDLEGGKPWDKKWIKLGGKTYSLNNIEHDILRPKYKDARIHFAVNCAAKSCPPVWNKAWTAANLNGQLEKATKSFINNSKYNSVGGSNAAISKIFEWYAVDFGNITDYLNKYASTKVAAGTAVTYQEYNWALNE